MTIAVALFENDELDDLLRLGAVAIVCYLAVEGMNHHLGDPLGGYHRWRESQGSGNYRLPAQLFFAAVGLWLYIGAPALALKLALSAWREPPGPLRKAGFTLAGALICILVRLVTMRYATATLAWS